MAPRVAKRAPGAAAGAAAKAARISEKPQKCDAVVDALMTMATDLPEPVRNMLADCAPNCLNTMAKDRVPAQAGVVGMIEEALQGIEERFQAVVNEAQIPVDSINVDRSGIDAKVVETEAKHAELQKAVSEAREVVTGNEESLRATKASIAETEQNQFGQLEKKRAELEAVLTDMYMPIKDQAADVKAVESLRSCGQRYELEEALLTSIAAPFQKEPEKRGPFDQAIFDAFENSLKAKIEGLTKELADEDADARETRKSGAATLAATQKETTEALEANKAILEATIEAEKVGQLEVTNAKAAVSEFLSRPEVKVKMDALGAGQKKLSSFREGILAFFQQLKDLAPAPKVTIPEATPEVTMGTDEGAVAEPAN